MSTPKTVSFYTLGCKLNYSESSSLARSFEAKAYAIVPFEQGADIVVINTCSVTDFADKKNRKVVRKAQKINPHSIIVVVGCYAQLKPEEIANIPDVDLVLGAGEKFKILHYIDNLSKANGKAIIHTGEIKEINSFVDAYSFGDRTRSFLKIQDGCDYSCSFCTIPKARGKSRSGTIDEVIKNATEIAESGVKEIVLTGVNIGDFGRGTDTIEEVGSRENPMFIDLIRALDEVEGIERFRISSIEPNLLSPEIIEFVDQSKSFVPHFHIPLQSGSDKILKLMKRRYLRKLYADRVALIRRIMPHASIGVDIIVGFPGETDFDFRETYDFVRRLDISYLHVFTYSERSGTPAVLMKGRVPMDVRRKRNAMLSQLSLKKQHAFYAKYVGQTGMVLVEKSKNKALLTGFTENYLKVEFPYREGIRNRIIEVKLNKINEAYNMEAVILPQGH